jgi:hypothetical protein
MGNLVAQKVQAIDLVVDRGLRLNGELAPRLKST